MRGVSRSGLSDPPFDLVWQADVFLLALVSSVSHIHPLGCEKVLGYGSIGK